MRLLPLLGLLGPATASPTPPGAREAGVGGKRLVLYAQDNFQGPAHEIEATNRCVKLEAPVYRNLHSYGVVDQVCYFMDTDRCNGKMVFRADAQGTKLDVGKLNVAADLIAAVYCSNHAQGGREVTDFVGAREAKDFAGAREVTDHVGTREAKDFAGAREAKDFTTAREANYFAVKRREVNDFAGAREAKDFAGAREAKDFAVKRREVNDFAGAREAKDFSGAREAQGFALKRREAKDFAGAREAKDFAGAREAGDFAIKRREVKNVASGREAKDFAVKRREVKDAAGAREVSDFAGAREVKDVEVKRQRIEDNYPSYPGKPIICEDTIRHGLCEVLPAKDRCEPIPEDWKPHMWRITYQPPGSICKYYTTSCDAKHSIMAMENRELPEFLIVAPEIASRIGFVKCEVGRPQPPKDIKVEWTEHHEVHIAPPTEKRAVSAKGDVRACKGNNCSWVQALNSCRAFSDDVVQQIDSLLQTAGSTCEYWENKDCSRLVLTSISGSQDYTPNLGPGNEDGKRISAVSCRASRFAEAAEEGKTIHANHDLETRSTAAVPCDDPHFLEHHRPTPPGFLYFCATINHSSPQKPDECENYRSCMDLDAMEKCVSLKYERNLFPLFDSLWQAHSAVCKYYRSSCTDEWPVLIIDSRNFYWPPINYKKVGSIYQIAAARCQYVADSESAYTDAGPNTIVIDSMSSLNAVYKDDTSLEGNAPAKELATRSTAATRCDDPTLALPGFKGHPGFLYFCADTGPGSWPEDCEKYRSCMGPEAMDKCASLRQAEFMFPLFDSLWQAEGAVCKYYNSSCNDEWPVLIIDSREQNSTVIDYKQLPFVKEISEVRCTHEPVGAELGAGPDTVVINSKAYVHARDAVSVPVKDIASVDQAEEPADSLITSTTGTTAAPVANYPVNMYACHDVNLGGRCVLYQGPGCAPNPFNVDAIESIKLPQGWRCALYPYWNCSAERGPPHYIESRDGELVIDDVTYDILSITCIPLPFEGIEE